MRTSYLIDAYTLNNKDSVFAFNFYDNNNSSFCLFKNLFIFIYIYYTDCKNIICRLFSKLFYLDLPSDTEEGNINLIFCFAEGVKKM